MFFLPDEFLIEDFLLVDIAWPERRLVLEVDGPWHFARTLPQGDLVLQGGTRLKRRLLQQLNWQVLQIDWESWAKDSGKALKPLQDLLRRPQPPKKDSTKTDRNSFSAFLAGRGPATPGGCNTKYSETEPTRGPSHSSVGAMDEKYQRLKVLGKGSFGKAYLVKNTEENALCERNEAVKEAMLLKKMDHPNIIRFKEAESTVWRPDCVAQNALRTRGCVGGALGIHAPSFGRSEALKEHSARSVSSSKLDGGEEWLHHWSRASTLAPYATNFHVSRPKAKIYTRGLQCLVRTTAVAVVVESTTLTYRSGLARSLTTRIGRCRTKSRRIDCVSEITALDSTR
eukprot:s111_g11.t1